MSFAERYGYRPTRTAVQVDDLDDETRTILWNAVHAMFLQNLPERTTYSTTYADWVSRVWVGHFKQRVDTAPTWHRDVREILSREVLEAPWYDVYSFLERVATAWPEPARATRFRRLVNDLLAAQLCGYRFVGNDIIQLTDENEIAAITQAQADAVAVPPAREHLSRAVTLLNDRQNPDYANSIKESIAAVEASARFVTGNPKATLGDALKKIDGLHPALRKGWLALYGYTSDAGGIRHAAEDEITSDVDHALYFLVTCSAFVSLLLAKSATP